MGVDAFWHDDKRLFEVYQKAYYRRIYEEAWLNGLYVNIAVQNTAGNMFAKKGAKPLEYPKEPFDPFKKSVSKEEIANEYADLQKEQNEFIRRLLNGEK